MDLIIIFFIIGLIIDILIIISLINKGNTQGAIAVLSLFLCTVAMFIKFMKG